MSIFRVEAAISIVYTSFAKNGGLRLLLVDLEKVQIHQPTRHGPFHCSGACDTIDVPSDLDNKKSRTSICQAVPVLLPTRFQVNTVANFTRQAAPLS